jgi:hypothetical protein
MCPKKPPLTSEGSLTGRRALTSEGIPVERRALTSESGGADTTPLTSEGRLPDATTLTSKRDAVLELHRQIAAAAPPRRRPNRTVTDEERAEWAVQRETWAREAEAKATQARSELVAALDNREQAERAVEVALLDALEVNKAETLIGLMGTSQATFWRIVKRARERRGHT